MSYHAYPVELTSEGWVKTKDARAYGLACVASVPSALESFKEKGTEGTGILYDMSVIYDPERVELINFLTSVICSAHKDWYTHDSGLRSPVFVYDKHTYDDVFYAVSPFRQVIEFGNVVRKFLDTYPLERLKKLTPRQVKRLWFTVNRISFNVAGTVNLGTTGNNHSAFTLMVYRGDGQWGIKPRAASQLINSDTYWRCRVGYPEGRKPPPFNKAGKMWTVSTRDVSVCPMFANTAKYVKVEQLHMQDTQGRSLIINHEHDNDLPSIVRHCFKVYDDVIKAVKPIQPRPVKFNGLEQFINTCKRRAA